MVTVDLQIVCGLKPALLNFDHLIPVDVRIFKTRELLATCRGDAVADAQNSERAPSCRGHERMCCGRGNGVSERRAQTPYRLHATGHNGDNLASSQSQRVVT